MRKSVLAGGLLVGLTSSLALAQPEDLLPDIFNDPPPDPTGYVDSGGVFAGHPHPEAIDTPEESKSATPDRHWQGDIIHERERFSESVRQERRAERRDKQRNAQGKAPLYFNT